MHIPILMKQLRPLQTNRHKRKLNSQNGAGNITYYFQAILFYFFYFWKFTYWFYWFQLVNMFTNCSDDTSTFKHLTVTNLRLSSSAKNNMFSFSPCVSCVPTGQSDLRKMRHSSSFSSRKERCWRKKNSDPNLDRSVTPTMKPLTGFLLCLFSLSTNYTQKFFSSSFDLANFLFCVLLLLPGLIVGLPS